LLHDLRNDWIDDMYILLGKTYYYRKNFDSALYVFRYINYAWAPRDKDNYIIPIGSNESNAAGEFSVSTKENNSLWKKITSNPPARNEALLWQAKTLIANNQLPEAGGIMEILRHDPNFPPRLQSSLHEAIAYWFYLREAYDSAAFHLSKSLDNATNQQEKARWEFLIAQMCQLSANNDGAIYWYNKSAANTTDPILEIYANLNSISSYSGNEQEVRKQKLNNLLKLAHKDKYVNNRDIIYYAIAQLEMEMNQPNDAQQMLQKSIQYSINNPTQKSKSFLLLADIMYDAKQYVASKNYYDSVDETTLLNDEDKLRITERQPALKIIADNINAIHLQDSLQSLAKLPKVQRDDIIKKLVKTIRKKQGLKDEDQLSSINPAVTQTTDMFFN